MFLDIVTEIMCYFMLQIHEIVGFREENGGLDYCRTEEGNFPALSAHLESVNIRILNE